MNKLGHILLLNKLDKLRLLISEQIEQTKMFVNELGHISLVKEMN